jgi:signal transduction histidine kinase
MVSRVTGSVRFRLTVAVMLVVGLALSAGGFVLVRWVDATLVSELRSRNERVLAAMDDALSQGQVPAELFSSPATLQNRIRNQVANSGALEGTSDIDQVVSSTYFYIDGPAFTQMRIRGVDAEGRLVLFSQQAPMLPGGTEALEVTRQVPFQGAYLTIHAISPLSEIDHSVDTLETALWLGLPLLVLLAGVLTWGITSRALAPVGAMTRRVRELSASNLDTRVQVPSNDDEIAVLAVTMNDMLDRLEQASVKERQFISDASHELRSPVASIRTQLETALAYPDDVDWPSVARTGLSEADRLDRLVGNLLAMARFEEGRYGPRGDVDLDEIVLEQAPRMADTHLDLSGVSAGRVWGNQGELTSVVRNLLDNAARHARDTVAVTVQDAGAWVCLTVSDDGCGIEPDERDSVFDRFTRLQEGRARDEGGTGLGLALTRRIVEHHGGHIHVEDSDLGGAKFVVELPAAANRDDAEAPLGDEDDHSG